MTIDLTAQAVQLVVYCLVGVATGFGLGSIWKWFEWFRG